MASGMAHERWAVLQVAEVMGIDLGRSIRTRECSIEALSQLLRTCGECWHWRKCAAWRRSSAVDTSSTAPAFCPSADMLEALAAKPITEKPRVTLSLASAKRDLSPRSQAWRGSAPG